MFDLNDIVDIPPFSLAHQEKKELYIHSLSDLTKHHYEKCPQYRKLLDILGFDFSRVTAIENIPFIPVRLFKEYELLSVDRPQVIKTMTSSGTTGQSVSKIYLDKTTSTHDKVSMLAISSMSAALHDMRGAAGGSRSKTCTRVSVTV